MQGESYGRTSARPCDFAKLSRFWGLSVEENWAAAQQEQDRYEMYQYSCQVKKEWVV
jgi:hypothetical protein